MKSEFVKSVGLPSGSVADNIQGELKLKSIKKVNWIIN